MEKVFWTWECTTLHQNLSLALLIQSIQRYLPRLLAGQTLPHHTYFSFHLPLSRNSTKARFKTPWFNHCSFPLQTLCLALKNPDDHPITKPTQPFAKKRLCLRCIPGTLNPKPNPTTGLLRQSCSATFGTCSVDSVPGIARMPRRMFHLRTCPAMGICIGGLGRGNWEVLVEKDKLKKESISI